MHSVLLVLLSLLGLSLLQSLLEYRRAIRGIGLVPGILNLNNVTTESYIDRHLSGPRLLISPRWFLGHLIRRVLPPIRPVSRESAWMIKKGYQGRGRAVGAKGHYANRRLT